MKKKKKHPIVVPMCVLRLRDATQRFEHTLAVGSPHHHLVPPCHFPEEASCTLVLRSPAFSSSRWLSVYSLSVGLAALETACEWSHTESHTLDSFFALSLWGSPTVMHTLAPLSFLLLSDVQPADVAGLCPFIVKLLGCF